MDDLKPCPFCGGKVQFNVNADCEPDGIACMHCHTLTRFMRTELKPGEGFGIAMYKMAEVWNRRTTDDGRKGILRKQES